MDISAYSMQGKRTHMEDFFDLGYRMKPCEERRPNEWPYEYFYFGVFDGHGGSEAAKFAKENLLKFITDQDDFWSNDDEDVMRAIRQGFADTHSAMRKQLSTWSRTNKILPSTAGTTASVLFIKNGKFYSGHVGDSRIVISRKHSETGQWISHQITDDHKPESQSEIERIERAGGEVRSKIGVHRVVWRRPVLNKEFDAKLTAEPKPADYDDCMKQIETYPVEETIVDSYQVIPFLAIARSLGDFWSINPLSGQFIVSPEPDVACRPIHPDDNCILLATDGLWNMLHSSLAIRFLQELKVVKDGQRDKKPHSEEYFATDNYYDVSFPGQEKNHALGLVYMAYQMWERRRLRSDNITAVVAMFSDILPPTQNRTSERRSSRHFTNESIKKSNPISSNDIQLGHTAIFIEQVSFNSEPEFHAADWWSEHNTPLIEKLENILVLPPTVLVTPPQSNIRLPNNYVLLSRAESRLVMRVARNWIIVKSVSDDPADGVQEPSRLNRKSVEVRDSSCQASQPMHDFGQPWHQLVNDDELMEEDDENSDISYESDGSDYELVPSHELKVGDIVKDSGRVITVDEKYLQNKLQNKSTKKPKKKRRFDGGDSNTMYPAYGTRSNRAHCV